MTTHSFDWIAQSPVGVFMAENELAFPWIESIHVLAVATVLGMMLVIDLRLIGWASTHFLPEWAELSLGVPAILAIYCWVIWNKGFGPEDRVLFRKSAKA